MTEQFDAQKELARTTTLWLGLAIIFCFNTLLLGGCGKKEDATKKAPAATLVSTVVAEARPLEIMEESVGTLEGLIDPIVSAEVPARVLKVLVRPGLAVKKGQPLVLLDSTDASLQLQEAHAEAARIEALLANQKQVVERSQKLVEKNFISKNALDEAATQQTALREQLDGARAKAASIANTRAKTQIVAPVDGIIQKQVVSAGDFVKIGDPLLQIVSKQRLRAHLPFPENIATKLQPGLTVRLTTPTSPNQIVTKIGDLKPMVESGSLSVDVIADVIDQPGWQPGASVNGVVVLGLRDKALVVPEQSVVLRPAGEVVYVIRNNLAEQRTIKTGMRQSGLIEILEGLSPGEYIAVDGAGFLTDKAPVMLAPAARHTIPSQPE